MFVYIYIYVHISKTQIIVHRGGVTKSILFKFLNSLELTSWPAVVFNIILKLIINHYLETFDLLKSCSWLAEFLIWQPSSSPAHTRSRAPLKKSGKLEKCRYLDISPLDNGRVRLVGSNLAGPSTFWFTLDNHHHYCHHHHVQHWKCFIVYTQLRLLVCKKKILEGLASHC